MSSTKILIVEGNSDESTKLIQSQGGLGYTDLFREMLAELSHIKKCEVMSVSPSSKNYTLPSPSDLKRYDGVMWTGSSFNIYKNPEIVRPQLDLMDMVFEVGVPIYGSCWGLQVAVTATGGEVSPHPKTWEVGVVKDMKLTAEGETHPMYVGKTTPIYSYCIHRDYISKSPKNATLLAYNEFCPVQGMEIKHKNSVFWGVQYHPEFNELQMLSTYRRLADVLDETKYFEARGLSPRAKGLEEELVIFREEQEKYAASINTRLQEIINWLKFI